MGLQASPNVTAMDGRLSQERYVESLRANAAGLLAAARSAAPDALVPGCPEWTTMDLVWHIGVVHRFWATIVAGAMNAPPDDWPPERPGDDAAVWAFAEESARLVVDALAAVAPATPVWTWCDGGDDAGWVIRRMAQETAVHRVDAEQTAGRDFRLDAVLAADGIDEFLRFFWPYTVREGDAPTGASIHLHCTDTDGEWTIAPDGTVTAAHAKGDVALRGPATDVLLVLWRRAGLDAVEIFGDRSLAARFVAATAND